MTDSSTPSFRARHLILWLTTGCNLRCTYCYMRAGDVPRQDMSQATLRRGFGIFGSELDDVQLSGGEPTLRPDLIEAAAQLAKDWGVRRISVQSNGIGISSSMINVFERYQIGLGISIDGVPAVHDSERGGSEALRRTMETLEQRGFPFGVTVVVSKTNVSRLDELVMMLAQYAMARSIGLDIVRVVGRASAAMLPTPEELRSGFAAMVEAIEWVNAKRSQPLQLRELYRVGCSDGSNGYCHTARGTAVVVTPDERLYPCASLVGMPEHRAGTLDEIQAVKLARGMSAGKVGCSTCALEPSCKGRCPARAALNPDLGRLDCVLREVAANHRLASGGASR